MNPITVRVFQELKRAGQKICMVTAYDATFARALDDAGADAILVGDSLGMVVQGHDSTLRVTLDQMVYHCQAVSRGVRRACVIGDLPFMSYQVSPEDAVRSAGRLLAEGGVAAVKLEGGQEHAEAVARIVRAGIPVMGHLGLTPQSVHAFGGFVVQGRDEASAQRIARDAAALEQAGCFALVLEGIPMELASEISAQLSIPTIGIGAGPGCDGQVLVCYDFLGLNPDFRPRFVKRYAELYAIIRGATEAFFADVRERRFPADEHSFHPRQSGAEPSSPAGGE